MKRKRNPVATPPRRTARRADPDTRLNELAKTRGVEAAEDAALSSEEKQGIVPWRATPSGLIGPDYAHVLLEGERNYDRIVDGAVLYDPNLDQVVLIEPDGNEVLVTVGTLSLDQALSGRGWKKILGDAVALAINAYSDEGPGVASHWLVRRVREAALLVLHTEGHSVDWIGLLPRDPSVVWRQLGKRWIVEPWGLGTHDELLGGWV